MVSPFFSSNKSKNGDLGSRRTEKPTNGEADEEDFRTEKMMSSRKRRASRGDGKEMAQTEEGVKGRCTPTRVYI
ncbi:hypothetical protein F2Q69_00026975 [Brassica cretica]|uniref:Uncharacterized protein n=1 Tax=Brassica cretica TaxID=69181 RepID=A0A8S9RS43_BRACR|nr:hypothetical protein F2Q69_00026975 [Brassica cretica]